MNSKTLEKVTRFMRPAAYAQACGVSEQTVLLWIRDHVIPAMKVKRLLLIDPIEADKALQQFRLKSKNETT